MGGVGVQCDVGQGGGFADQEWARAELLLEQGSVPAPVGFKPSGVLSLQLKLVLNQNYDVYFDDVAFMKN